jgi:phosphopantothenoylcysteine decarboxylase/phosphopantothenate--cysteine ligase
MSKGKILFQLSGSIACFKACALISRLVKDGYEVEVVATNSALKFVGEATLEGLTGRRVHTDTFAGGDYMSHIRLERWADLLLLCPATANLINKLANGIGDDLVSTLFLAHDFKKPYLIAPAMNEKMIVHPTTQAAMQKLSGWGIRVLQSGAGSLACGENGEGRLLEPDELYREIEKALAGAPRSAEQPSLSGTEPMAATKTVSSSPAEISPGTTNRKRRALVTSGGTREPIDGVRAITNTSTGRTGAAIAQRLTAVGYAVTLVRAADAVGAEPKMAAIRELTFVTFKDLHELLRTELGVNDYDVIVHSAAVSDFSVDGAGKGKLESDGDLVLKLKPNPKLIDELRALSKNKRAQIVAFKLTSSASVPEREAAVRKLIEHAHPDFVVLNDASEVGASAHTARIFTPEMREVAKAGTKLELAEMLGRVLQAQERTLAL